MFLNRTFFDKKISLNAPPDDMANNPGSKLTSKWRQNDVACYQEYTPTLHTFAKYWSTFNIDNSYTCRILNLLYENKLIFIIELF